MADLTLSQVDGTLTTALVSEKKLAEGYGHQDVSSAKRMFERDKDILRDIGVPIDVVSTDAWDVEQGYSIDKARYYLPEIAFTPEEVTALFVAVRSAVCVGGRAGEIRADLVRSLRSSLDRKTGLVEISQPC